VIDPVADPVMDPGSQKWPKIEVMVVLGFVDIVVVGQSGPYFRVLFTYINSMTSIFGHGFIATDSQVASRYAYPPVEHRPIPDYAKVVFPDEKDGGNFGDVAGGDDGEWESCIPDGLEGLFFKRLKHAN